MLCTLLNRFIHRPAEGFFLSACAVQCVSYKVCSISGENSIGRLTYTSFLIQRVKEYFDCFLSYVLKREQLTYAQGSGITAPPPAKLQEPSAA